MEVLYSVGKETTATAKIARVIPKESMKTLDAPDLLDDFYCHLVRHSSFRGSAGLGGFRCRVCFDSETCFEIQNTVSPCLM